MCWSLSICQPYAKSFNMCWTENAAGRAIWTRTMKNRKGPFCTQFPLYLPCRVCVCFSPSILVHSSCYKRTSETEWPIINKKHVTSTVPETEDSQMEAPADSVSDQGLISGLEMDLLSVTSRGRRCQGVLWGLFCNGTNLIHEGSTFIT